MAGAVVVPRALLWLREPAAGWSNHLAITSVGLSTFLGGLCLRRAYDRLIAENVNTYVLFGHMIRYFEMTKGGKASLYSIPKITRKAEIRYKSL